MESLDNLHNMHKTVINFEKNQKHSHYFNMLI